MSATKTYLGDAVYAQFDERDCLVLTTNDGYRDTSTIILEQEVWLALVLYVGKVRLAIHRARTGNES